MEYSLMDQTGPKVPPLCMGVQMFGGGTLPKNAYRIFATALHSGIIFAGTANVISQGISKVTRGKL